MTFYLSQFWIKKFPFKFKIRKVASNFPKLIFDKLDQLKEIKMIIWFPDIL